MTRQRPFCFWLRTRLLATTCGGAALGLLPSASGGTRSRGWGMPARKIGSSGLLKKLSRSSSIEASVSAGVTLPSDLSKSLQYLDDAQLERLRAGVAAEINRRDQGAQKRQAGTAASSRAPPVRERRSARQEELPEGKANLIRASFNAGLKPATIARTFHVSQAVVHSIIRSTEKPTR